jgi:Fe-S-cluster-containing dehydrogenase component
LPVSCHRCERPACQLVCPTGATYRDPLTGALLVTTPLPGLLRLRQRLPSATLVDADSGRVLKCDLCGGDPACVKVCPTGRCATSRWSQDPRQGDRQPTRLSELVQAALSDEAGR